MAGPQQSRPGRDVWMDVRKVVVGLARRWWLLVLATSVGAIVAYAVAAQQPERYRAETTVVVVPIYSLEDTGDLIDSIETLERRTILATYARIIGGSTTRDTAMTQLGWDSESTGYYWTHGSVVPYTNMLRIEVQGPDPDKSADLANMLAEVAGDEARSTYRIYRVKTVEPAEADSDPIEPQPLRNAVIGAVLGFVLSLFAVLSLLVWTEQQD